MSFVTVKTWLERTSIDPLRGTSPAHLRLATADGHEQCTALFVSERVTNEIPPKPRNHAQTLCLKKPLL